MRGGMTDLARVTLPGYDEMHRPLPADRRNGSASRVASSPGEGGMGIMYGDGDDQVLVPHGHAACPGRTGRKTNLGHHDAGTFIHTGRRTG